MIGSLQWIVVILLFAIVPLTANAARVDEFFLRNTSNVTIHFSYGCSADTRRYQREVPARSTVGFDWGGLSCASYDYLQRTTYQGQVKSESYTLYPGHTYHVFWDASQSVWNLEPG